MIAPTPSQFYQFWENLKTNSQDIFDVELKGFVYGDDDALIENTAKLEYPMLMVEDSDGDEYVHQGDNVTMNIIGAFSVIYKLKKGEEKIDAFAAAKNITEQILREMRAADYFLKGDRFRTRKIYLTHDTSCIGYRTEYIIKNRETNTPIV